MSIDAAKALRDFVPSKKFFVGIDSDGSAIDSMAIKQRECFGPWMVTCFDLEPVAEAAWLCKEFADMYSKTRGANRHVTVARILTELLPRHPQVIERGFKVSPFKHYCDWVNNPKSRLSETGLQKAIAEAVDAEAKKELGRALEWTRKVDQAVKDAVKDMRPFEYVRQSLEKAGKRADIVVVSMAPGETLQREWQEHDLAKYVRIIAGQEMGTKIEHLEIATKGKYESGHTLMIGDAPGDLKAARKAGSLFYPINPGDEVHSWKRFHDEAFDKFICGTYAGAYEAKLVAEFDKCLPEHPPWHNRK